MIPAGIIIYGKSNVGKTTTIIAIKEKLVAALMSKGAEIVEDVALYDKKDFRTIIKLNNRKLLILSVGDTEDCLVDNYKDKFDHEIDFVLGASRTKGVTTSFWTEKIAIIHWYRKTIPNNAEQKEAIDYCYHRLLDAMTRGR